jgi:hypothetical protein
MITHLMHRNSGNNEHNERVDVFFTAKKWEGQIFNAEPYRCDDLSWFELDNLPENTCGFVLTAIDKIKGQIFYSEYGW